MFLRLQHDIGRSRRPEDGISIMSAALQSTASTVVSATAERHRRKRKCQIDRLRSRFYAFPRSSLTTCNGFHAPKSPSEARSPRCPSPRPHVRPRRLRRRRDSPQQHPHHDRFDLQRTRPNHRPPAARHLLPLPSKCGARTHRGHAAAERLPFLA